MSLQVNITRNKEQDLKLMNHVSVIRDKILERRDQCRLLEIKWNSGLSIENSVQKQPMNTSDHGDEPHLAKIAMA